MTPRSLHEPSKEQIIAVFSAVSWFPQNSMFFLAMASDLRTFSQRLSKLLDNAIKRVNHYISLTRRRLTIGSHTGAEAAILYHSLAITCHRCGVNVFDYFCEIIDKCAAWPPNTSIE